MKYPTARRRITPMSSTAKINVRGLELLMGFGRLLFLWKLDYFDICNKTSALQEVKENFNIDQTAARNFDYQDPVKNRIVRESNFKYGGNGGNFNGKSKGKKRVQNTNFEYDYYSNAWDKLIAKTQEAKEFMPKGSYAHSYQRDVESKESKRIISPVNSTTHFDFSEISVKDKGQGEFDENKPSVKYTKSNFKMNYSQKELHEYKEKPSKKFNHPNSLSKEPIWINGNDSQAAFKSRK